LNRDLLLVLEPRRHSLKATTPNTTLWLLVNKARAAALGGFRVVLASYPSPACCANINRQNHEPLFGQCVTLPSRLAAQARTIITANQPGTKPADMPANAWATPSASLTSDRLAYRNAYFCRRAEQECIRR